MNEVDFKPRRMLQYQDQIAKIRPSSNEDGLSYGNNKILSRTVTWQVTDNCNLACTYCYQTNKGKRRMNFETAKKLVDELLAGKNSKLNNYISVDKSPAIILEFIGGEPFMEIELIDKVCDYFLKRAFELRHPWAVYHMISICSNGVLYRDKRVQKFLEKHKNNISFSVTLDGNKELHDSCRVFANDTTRGSYDLAYDACSDWMARGNYMGSKITIAAENLKYLFSAGKHMMDLGYEDINMNCVYEENWNAEHAKLFYSEMKKIADYKIENNLIENVYISLFDETFFSPKAENDNDNWCGGTGSMLSMDPDGWLFPCLRYMESSLGDERPRYSIGHIDTGIGDTQCNKDRIECLNCITRRSQSTDECFDCPIANGCSWCFKAGTLISTPNGSIPIENIKIGDIVLSGTGVPRVVEMTNNRYTEDTIIVNATGILPIHTTSEHPFLVREFYRKGNNLLYTEPKWKKASDIKQSDRIGILVNKFGDKHIDPNIAYLVGRYIGDGWINSYIRNNCESIEYHLCCDYAKTSILESYFENANISVCKDKTKRTAQEYNIHITNHSDDNMNELLVSILSECGRYAHGKKIPNQVFTWDRESVENLLKGYFDSDGYYDPKNETVKFTTVSYELANNISSILLMFGKKVNWSIRPAKVSSIEGRTVNCKETYELSFLIREPIRKYYDFDEANSILWVNVKNVVNDTPGIVYNMSVSDEHTFLANNVIVHNCSAYNYQVYGTPDSRVTNICIMHKARSLANVYYWNKVFIKLGIHKYFENFVKDEWALEIISEEELSTLKELEKEAKERFKDCESSNRNF